ncbi:MAG: response regulator [Chloroflexi bacterium]|nr:response regulator [Chloroflexota bacterium]
MTLAADERRALLECQAGRPDVVLRKPLLLPWVDGLALCRRIRTSFGGVLMLLTTGTLEADVSDGVASGAGGCITKPFSPKQVLLRLDSALASGPDAHARAFPRPEGTAKQTPGCESCRANLQLFS